MPMSLLTQGLTSKEMTDGSFELGCDVEVSKTLGPAPMVQSFLPYVRQPRPNDPVARIIQQDCSNKTPEAPSCQLFDMFVFFKNSLGI